MSKKQRQDNVKDTPEKIAWAEVEVARILDHLTPKTAIKLIVQRANLKSNQGKTRERTASIYSRRNPFGSEVAASESKRKHKAPLASRL